MMESFLNKFEVLRLYEEGGESSSQADAKYSKKKDKNKSNNTTTLKKKEGNNNKKNNNSISKEKDADNGVENDTENKFGDKIQELDVKLVRKMWRPLVWIDLEMTGLDVERDRILEIACIITDGNLETIVEGPNHVIHEPEETLAAMNEWCQEHHTQSGLVERVRRSSITLVAAEKQVSEFLDEHLGSDQLQLAGNSVYVDLLFLKKHMPTLAMRFTHVLVDVSSIRALCQRWFPRQARGMPKKAESHRALEDIKESIAELKYLKKHVFKLTSRG